MLLKTTVAGMQDADNVPCDTTGAAPIKEKANENDATNRLLMRQTSSCKAPIASLDCMEDFAGATTTTTATSATTTPTTAQAQYSNANVTTTTTTMTTTSAAASPVPTTQRIHYKNLGKSGIRVSNIGLATWITFGNQVSDEVAEDIVTLAYENGINIFDTAEAFTAGRAEVLLGKILKKKEWRRSSYVVTTKLYWNSKAETERGLSRKHIIEGVHSSLNRLQLSYVDVVFANKADPLCPMEEIVRAFTYCINQNIVMYWGTSQWSPTEIMEAFSVARQFNLIAPICEQMEYHMFCREKCEIQLPEMYHKIGVGAITWSPLVCGGVVDSRFDNGNGQQPQLLPPTPSSKANSIKGYTWLKDKLQSDDARKQQAKIDEVCQIADKLGCTFSQLTIAWCLRNEIVHCVLVGATTAEQIYEHLQALQVRPKLTTGLMHQLDVILDNKPVRRAPRR